MVFRFTAPSAGHQVRRVLSEWAEATRTGRRDDVLANHAADAVIFDVLPPLKYDGLAAYERSRADWQPQTKGQAIFRLHELNVSAGDDVAFAHGLIHCGGTRVDGKRFEDWVRATFCLVKFDGEWTIAHQHISMPLKVGRSAR
jgi:ketosteroid isomerase-like protein